MRSLSSLLIVLLLLTACAADPPTPTTSDSDGDGDTWTLVIADGEPSGPGMGVSEALTHGPTDDLVTVTGALFVNADGSVVLCDAIAESFPPQCAGDRIAVEGLLTSDIADLQEANGVRWAEDVTLLGSVE